MSTLFLGPYVELAKIGLRLKTNHHAKLSGDTLGKVPSKVAQKISLFVHTSRKACVTHKKIIPYNVESSVVSK